ncbi:hypothetical protein Mal4_17620 [Maioricimonas rarisocia]|uniref:Uncharacterized protein n=1 Tax=Maioricimonas rarisocia TaxID=2528026 RepID=A0A517Z4R8_9PLAN|nr:hypothetical protein [Maioricimonas rarisocia]QDU37449.1 hypothetical protein Mal4_17620 [Maioricimonas rarisocia]
MTRLPSRRSRADDGSRNAATMLALLGLLLVSFGLLALTAMVLPQIAAVLLVIMGFVGIFAVHYLTWGRLMQSSREDEPAE